jgi:hypothetical protein
MDIFRCQDWEERLALYLDRINEVGFAWGRHDCALFAADCVNAMTGVDPAERYRGKYDTARGAAEALRLYGAGTLLKTMKSIFWQVSVSHAQRGDVVMLDRTTTGICAGQYSWFVGREQARESLIPIPTSSCRFAFRVPYESVTASTGA